MSRRLTGGMPASDKLIKHAERHGVDGIAETGAESGLDEEQLTALIIRLDAINAAFRKDPKRKALHITPPRSAPVDPGKRARLLLGIPEPDPLAKTSPDADGLTGKIREPKKEELRGGGAGTKARRSRAQRAR